MKNSKVYSEHFSGEAIRFIILGSFNTIFTFAIFIGLSILMPSWAAYSIGYFLGLAINGIGTSKWVFSRSLELKTLTLYLLWYLLIYTIGQIIIWISNPTSVRDSLFVSLGIILTTTPLNFVGANFIFSKLSAIKKRID